MRARVTPALPSAWDRRGARGRSAPPRDRKCRAARLGGPARWRCLLSRPPPPPSLPPGRIQRPCSWSWCFFVVAAVTGTMNKKKKPFLGMPAPLGYVPGLGRG